MKCILRDDDISFFTSFRDLIKTWGWFLNLDNSKLNLAVIPFVSGEEFGKDNKIYPLGENLELKNFLIEKIKNKKIEILLHGYSHNSIKGIFEFGINDFKLLYKKIKEGKEYLEALLNVKISFFVPPHNTLSKAGLKAVIENRLNILSSIPFSPFKIGFSVENILFFIRRFYFSFIYRKEFKKRRIYPYYTKFSLYKYLDFFPFLPNIFSKEDFISIYNIIKKENGIFSLATHYYELDKEKLDILKDLIFEISKYKDNAFIFASELYG